MTQSDKSSPPTSANKSADLFEAMLRTAVNAPREQIAPRQTVGPAALSFAQQRLWFLDKFGSGNPAYNVFRALRLTGQFTPAILESGLNEMVRRHEILRTNFTVVEGQPVQVIAPTLTLSLPVIDLSDLPEPAREAQIEQYITQESQRVFNLSQGPLLQVTLLQVAEEEQILLLVMHHIITDGWSVTIFLRELTALYGAYSQGNPSPLAKPPIQYADYAAWQREWLQGEVLENQLAYWKQRLADHPPLLNIPTDHPRPAMQTYDGAVHSTVVSKALTARLKALSQDEGVTLFMTFLAAFKVLLYRYSSQEDISVGSPIVNRNRAEIRESLGIFINTLVLRTDLSGNPSFQVLLTRVRETAMGAYTHQDLPFEKLVEELQPIRDLSVPPLFQVLFNMLNFAGSSLDLPGLTAEHLAPPQPKSQFDLTLNAIERNEEIHLKLVCKADLFDTTTIIRMMGHFVALLKDIVADPTKRLSDLSILTDVEQHQLLVEWNDTQVDYPKDLCIYELFEAQVERTPEAIAAIFEDEQLTYQQLNRRANQLAHYLQGLGVGPEVLVGICVERSLNMLVGILGIIKAGGAYVPIDPTYPQERKAFILNDTQAPVLLTQQRLVEALPDCQGHIVCLDTNWEIIAQEKGENTANRANPTNLVYVIYTSGSTGQPKGVAIEHRSLTNYLWWVNKNLLDEKVSSLPLVTNLTFDASLKQLFSPLLIGEQVRILSEETIAQPAALLQLLSTQPNAGFNCVPSLWTAMLDELDSRQQEALNENLTSLFVGGEQLTKELVDRSIAVIPDLEIWNLYGPTEATANASFARIAPGNAITIGRPIANTQLYILDCHLQPVPVGVHGELYIGGDGLARGYLNRPELTAEMFVRNPFGEGRLYKTGDMVRYLPDGNIEYVGRADYQVKLRGYRIELGEIEALLNEYSAVQETVVVAHQYASDDKRLVAYVVPSSDSSPTRSELRNYLEEKLPTYMIPSVFIMLETLPLNSNGKVDRQALPAPDSHRPDLEATYIAPESEAERIIAKIWQKVLRLERVGLRDNFFDLGGHSLLLVQIHSGLRDVFDRDITLVDMFKYPTIGALANYLSQQDGAQTPSLQKHDTVEKLAEGKDRLKQLYKRRRQR